MTGEMNVVLIRERFLGVTKSEGCKLTKSGWGSSSHQFSKKDSLLLHGCPVSTKR